ncbi:MFS transporter [Streptomyces sp. NPDC096105]|uniref:MFS transporter n=1 Tax=Streptomyces sp. NPDC096105 TaxID=3366074 RepID=UPI0037FC8CDD
MKTPSYGPALTALAASQFVVIMGTSIVNVALPAVQEGIGLADSGMSWVVNAYGLAFGALLLIGGRVADLLGRRRLLLGGLALCTVSSLAAGLATEPWSLLTARALQGVGAAAAAPASLALLLHLFPPGPGRGRALGVWGAVSGAGGAAGVVIGGLLTESWGWPSIFHVSAAGTLLALVATVLLVDAGPADARAGGRLDLTGTLTMSLGLTTLIYGLTAASDFGWSSWPVLASLAAGAVLLTSFGIIESRHPAPLLPPRLLAQGLVTPTNLIMALFGAIWLGMFFFLPVYQQRVLGAGPLETGLSQLPLAATNIAGSVLAPRLARRFGPYVTLGASLGALAAGLLWLGRISADGGYVGNLLGPVVVIGLGSGIAFVQLTGLAVTGVRPADTGLASGLVNATRQLGSTVGLALLTTLAASATASSHGDPAETLTDGYRAAFLVCGAVVTLTALAVPLLARRVRRQAAAAATTTDRTDTARTAPKFPQPAAR